MKISAVLATDFYKTGHIFQYPPNTQYVYSNFTPRGDKLANVLPDFDHKVVNFGLQGVCQWLLVDMWNDTFFSQPKAKVVSKYKRIMDSALGPNVVPVDHIAALYDLGYLPVEIKALPEGARVDVRVPLWTIINTHPDFGWVTNYLETQLSSECWKPITSATTAYEYKRLLTQRAIETGSPLAFVPWQGHDFSMRGMSGIHDAAQSGAAHLLSFTGTDTISSIEYLEEYYVGEQTFVGGSVPATEHSVMCMGGVDSEIDTFKRLINDEYPNGVISIVSDTWDFWKVITEYTVTLKQDILARNGKVVLRPDSGDPVDILCGTAKVHEFKDAKSLDDAIAWLQDTLVDKVRAETPHGERGDSEVSGYVKYDNQIYAVEVELDWNRYDKQYYYIDEYRVIKQVAALLSPEEKGAVECLWEVFGGTVTDKGFKLLDEHIGLIYGDSITLDRATQILNRLRDKGFASGNIVFGIGSFTYQYVTRDSYGTAIKATWGVVDNIAYELYKDPKTDNGLKKSAKGLIRIENENGKYVLYDQQTREQEKLGELRTIFKDSKIYNFQTLEEIRNRLNNQP